MIDLTDVDLDMLSDIPAPVLRKVITRVSNELRGRSSEPVIYAGFRSSLAVRAESASDSSAPSDDPDSTGSDQ
jgi:FXSXX-COOH protein